MPSFDSIEGAIKEIKAGNMVVVVDNEDRENEGDLIMAASKVTPQSINFMAQRGRGLICAPMDEVLAKNLQLDLMVEDNNDPFSTNFTVSVDLKGKTTTGISMLDRAATIEALADPNSLPEQFSRPGHVFPLVARKGGVKVRAGHTEAAVDLARLAGYPPVGVLCEIINDNGEMARLPDLYLFSKFWDLKLISIQDLIDYRVEKESYAAHISMAT